MNLYATCCESSTSSLAVTQYPPIAPSRNQVVKLLPQPGHLVGRAQIMPGGTPNPIHKAKQPQQILPKPIPPNSSPQKQSVPRLSTAMPQQTPLLINQPQTQSPALLLNQVLTSGAPVIVQPAGPGGTVHLMLRTPTPALQSGPGPPQNKMIIANTTQPQPQATVLIQNRQQVVRFMTAQGPMQLQQIQTPSGPQLIAIPQNQSLSFPTNSVLVQSPTTNALQLQQNSGNLQLRQSPSAIIQPSSFPSNQISLQNPIFQAGSASTAAAGLKRDDLTNPLENAVCLTGSNEQKKIVIDNKITTKKNVNTVSCSSNSNNFNNGGNSNNCNTATIYSNSLIGSLGNNSNNNLNKKNTKSGKKVDEESLNRSGNRNFIGKTESVVSPPISLSTSTAPKNITSSLRQIRPGALANRKQQNQNTELKEKPEDSNSKSMSNLTRIIDSVASNTEHLMSPPPKIDNLTATINSVAENIKSPTPDDIMSNLTLNDVFMAGNKALTLNKRPNLTIVQKLNKVTTPEIEESSMNINRLIMSPSSNSAVDFENISENYDALELSGITTSSGAQTSESPGFIIDQNTSSSQGVFQGDDTKKGKKKGCSKKKGKKEENKVDLWDLMKSAGIGDDEFDEPSEIAPFTQDIAAVGEPLEISAADTDLLAQIQNASQVPGGIRVVVGEDGRPVIINGTNVLVPESTHNTSSTAAVNESSESEAVLQNMIVPDNVFNFTPQAFATAQTQLNQLIQDHGGLTTSSADQQLLSQIFGATNSIPISSSNSIISNSSSSIVQSNSPSTLPTIPTQSLPPTNSEKVIVNPPSNEVSQPSLLQKQEPKPEFIGGPPPGLPPLGPDSLVITNNNGVPTLVASPALMQYLQTHQGIIQFQHDPVTKTIQPSLIIPHPQHKIEPTPPPSQETRMLSEKTAAIAPNNIRTPSVQDIAVNRSQRSELKTSVGTTTDEQKNNLNNVSSVQNSVLVNPNVVKFNMVKLVKDNPSLLQLATEMNNLIGYKERNKNLTGKEVAELDKKIQQNRAILDQCFLMENSRGNQVSSATVQNVIIKDSVKKETITYQVGNVTIGEKVSPMNDKTTETQALEDLQNLDMTLMKSFHPPQSTNSPAPNSDFQAKFLESIGMASKTPVKATVTIGTGTTPVSPSIASVTPTPSQSSSAMKRGRKKKEKIQNQAIQADVKADIPSLTFNIAELTPEQNVRLNQALQNRGAIINQIENLDAIKQIIHEEVRKITSGSMENANIRFTSSSGVATDDRDTSEQCVSTANVVLSNSQVLEQTSSQNNVISLQGNELVAINSGNQQIYASQNQVLTGNHFVSSNNQILTIGGSHNQLVSLGNPINSSNQIVTLGNSSNLMSVGGSNVASPGAVIVGSNGNVVAIVHQNSPSGQNPGIVQRIQTIQLTAPKQQHFKTIQSQIQTLSAKLNRSATEQATLQKLVLEQQKILSTGKLVPAFSGQPVQGMQIVSQQIGNNNRVYQTQATQQHQQTQLSQTLTQTQQLSQPLQHQTQTFVASNTSLQTSQSSKPSFSSQTVVSCGTNTSDFTSFQSNIPKVSVPPTVMISDVPTSNYGPLYVSPNTSGKNVTKCEKGTSPIQIQMGTQTVTNMEFRSGKMSTGTMTSPNTGKPQAVVAPAIVIQQTENSSPTYQMKPRNQTTVSEPLRTQVPTLSRTAFIEQQMRTDQAGATMPDTKTPFLSKSDACKRLIRYHVMDEKSLSPQDLATADDIFEATAQHLLDKFRAMKEKYKYLLMLESMREVSTAERIMVDRNFIIEERIELEELREKEKRLQEEFENPTIVYPRSTDSSVIKTEFILDDVKTEIPDFSLDNVKTEEEEENKDTLISKNKNNNEMPSDFLKDNSLKVTEANRNVDLSKIKSETKECKNTRTFVKCRSESPIGDSLSISSKCKAKNSRTFSDGSSKSSLDSSKDEDSGTDINAQVQSAIDSILNLQKCETMSESVEEGGEQRKRLKKKRKFGDKPLEGSKKLKIKGFDSKKEKNTSDDSDEDDEEGSSDADPILDEAIRSILTS